MSHSLGLGIPSIVLAMSSLVMAQSGPQEAALATSAERMVLVSGQLDVAYGGQEPAMLSPGMYAYGPARLAHSASCRSADPCVLFIAFEGPVDAIPTAGSNL